MLVLGSFPLLCSLGSQPLEWCYLGRAGLPAHLSYAHLGNGHQGFILFMCMYLYEFVSTMCVQAPTKVTRGCQVFWNWRQSAVCHLM